MSTFDIYRLDWLMVRTSRSFDTLRNYEGIIVEKALQAIYTTKTKGCITNKGPWYVSAVKEFAMEWIHETFGKRNVVGRFYKRFLWNAKYELVYR